MAFLGVSLHEEHKNTTKIFSKIRPKNLKKSQKKLIPQAKKKKKGR
jgi:hypothetical protein